MRALPYGAKPSYADRIRGILMLDPRTFQDVEQDTDATGQAVLTVILAALAAGIGAILSRDIVPNTIGVVVSSVLQWIVFSFVAYFVGSTLFASNLTSVTPGQVLRTIGFAQAPNFLLVLGIIPLLGWIAGLVAFIWFIVAAVMALREAFEFDTGRAMATGLVALIGIGIVQAIFAIFFGISSALFSAISSAFRGIF